jgi:hypothetical protein
MRPQNIHNKSVEAKLLAINELAPDIGPGLWVKHYQYSGLSGNWYPPRMLSRRNALGLWVYFLLSSYDVLCRTIPIGDPSLAFSF